MARSNADYGGARGSNAGDQFHELWALDRALSLLNPATDLQALTVEGVRTSEDLTDDKATAKELIARSIMEIAPLPAPIE